VHLKFDATAGEPPMPGTNQFVHMINNSLPAAWMLSTGDAFVFSVEYPVAATAPGVLDVTLDRGLDVWLPFAAELA
jgi:hypothetical protein